MPNINVDLDEIADIPNILPGDYLAKLTRVTKRLSKRGHPMWVWRWKIVRGTHRGCRLESFSRLKYPYTELRNHLMAFGVQTLSNIDTDDFLTKRACLMVGSNSSILAVLPAEAFKGGF